MQDPSSYPSDIAFTPTVKDIQARKGSRPAYQRMEETRGWATSIDADIRAFIEAQTSFFMATANRDGQPYIQHRGGPAGFLRVIDPTTIAFVDYSGNRQFITQGNLHDNPKAHLFLIDYAHRQRVKLWGEARVIEGDEARMAALFPSGYRAKAEQVIEFKLTALDVNCPKHIPQRFEAEDVARALREREAKIETLESEIAILRARLAGG